MNEKNRPPIKAIISADLHLDVNNRLEDKTTVLRQMARYAVKNNINTFFILGDIYERVRPYNSEKAVFEKFVKYLSDNNIEVVILAGNHDMDKDGVSAVEEFKILQLPNIRLINNPSMITFGDFKLFLGHFLVSGAKLGPSDFVVGTPINLKDIFKKFKADIYCLGDVHKAQKLNDNPPALYVGSPERNTFGERKEIKGFTLLEATDKLTYKFIPLKTRPMVQYNIISPQTWLKNNKESGCRDAIVKIKITCTKEQYSILNEDDIRNKLKEAHSIKIEYDIIKENRIRNESINESSSSSEAFKNYAKFSKLDKDTITLGLKVIKETK